MMARSGIVFAEFLFNFSGMKLILKRGKKGKRRGEILFFFFLKLHRLDVERVGRKYFNLGICGI